MNSTYYVSGLSCASCVNNIKKKLLIDTRILNVNVTLITKEVEVLHNPIISSSEIKDFLSEIGFESTLIRSGKKNDLSNVNNNLDYLSTLNLEVHLSLNSFEFLKKKQLIVNLLNNTTGIIKYNFNLNVQSEISDFIPEHDNQNQKEKIYKELSINFNHNVVGVRDFLKKLNSISKDILFVTINYDLQTTRHYLQILSRKKEINYWKSNFLKLGLISLFIFILDFIQKKILFSKLFIFPGLHFISLLQIMIGFYSQFKIGSFFTKNFFIFYKNKFKHPNMEVLIFISTFSTFTYSVVSFTHNIFLKSDIPPDLLISNSVSLICFVSFGKWIQNKTIGNIASSLSKLLSLKSSTCNLITNSDFINRIHNLKPNEILLDFDKESLISISETISVDLLQQQDVLVVYANEKVPADGIIFYGETELDESFLTGEQMPVYKKKKDRVFAGLINGPFNFLFLVEKLPNKSRLSCIVDLVFNFQKKKISIERFSDFFSSYFIPFIITLSLSTFIFWFLYTLFVPFKYLPKIFSENSTSPFFFAFKISVSVIVVACPCSIGLAVPTAIMAGSKLATKHGIFFKTDDIFEKIKPIKYIFFDKTGTLTTNNLTVTNINFFFKDKQTYILLWSLIGAVESQLNHPISIAIYKEARFQLEKYFCLENLSASKINDLKVFPGLGVTATLFYLKNTYHITIGNFSLIKQKHQNLNVNNEFFFSNIENNNNSHNTVAYIVLNDSYIGSLHFSEELKPNIKQIIDYLKNVEKYEIGIITGDNKNAAYKIGNELSIPTKNIYYNMQPEQKQMIISSLQKNLKNEKKKYIVYVGDGYNDILALKQADIGITLNSDLSISNQVSEIVCMSSFENDYDTTGVLNSILILKLIYNRIKMNFIWAFSYNFFLLPFSIGMFIPFNIFISPSIAGAFMGLSSVSVVFSSLILSKWKPPIITKLNLNNTTHFCEKKNFTHLFIKKFSFIKGLKTTEKLLKNNLKKVTIPNYKA